METAVVIDALRTPVAKACPREGWYRDVRSDDLSADLIRELVGRNKLDPALVEDVKWGCCQQQGEQAFDIARTAALLAGLPVETTGVTIHRNCASSLEAIHLAAMSIQTGNEDVQIAGGVEHMDHVPMMKDVDPSQRLYARHSKAIMNMGLTAENLAQLYGISREEQDAFAVRSHHLAAAAQDRGEFESELSSPVGRDLSGRKVRITRDQCVRADSSVEDLAKLRPVFLRDGTGTVTAGSSSPLSVGAAALLMMSSRRAEELGLKPIAQVVSHAVAGVAPEIMGIGPVPATQQALKRAGLALGDIGCIELNEAFAAQSLAVLREWGVSDEKVNTRGGAIAIGHPLGGSGARIATTLLHRMRSEGQALGLATMCVGMGQGSAAIFKLVE
ncbi:MAG: acetyl-CoA C-acyltransferase [Verrucomicrobiales bacterium]|nr:acetyl-CoA C-acyltransferase [Verrucomicrobiales bacterium]